MAAHPLAVGTFVKCMIWTSDVEQAAVNSVYYKVTAIGGTPATDQDVCDAVDTIVSGSIQALMNNNATYNGVQAQIVAPGTVLVSVSQTSHAGAGTGGAVALPKQACGITSFYTDTAGPKGRGRNYLPFASTGGDSGDGKPSSGYITSAQAMYVALMNLTAIAAGGRTATVSLVIYNRPTKTGIPVIRMVTRAVWATQKRRGAFGRTNKSPI
jgi:hypothetical protein